MIPDPKQPFGFDAQSIRRISDVVRHVEQDLSRQRPPGGIPRPSLAVWIARPTAYVANGAVGTFTIRGKGGNKGSEVDSDYTCKAYVREGLCFASKDYLLIECCIGDDAVFEVIDPSVTILGKTDNSHAKGASGTISVYSGTLGSETDTTNNITAWNHFGDVASGKWVLCHWRRESAGWDLGSAECS